MRVAKQRHEVAYCKRDYPHGLFVVPWFTPYPSHRVQPLRPPLHERTRPRSKLRLSLLLEVLRAALMEGDPAFDVLLCWVKRFHHATVHLGCFRSHIRFAHLWEHDSWPQYLRGPSHTGHIGTSAVTVTSCNRGRCGLINFGSRFRVRSCSRRCDCAAIIKSSSRILSIIPRPVLPALSLPVVPLPHGRSSIEVQPGALVIRNLSERAAPS